MLAKEIDKQLDGEKDNWDNILCSLRIVVGSLALFAALSFSFAFSGVLRLFFFFDNFVFIERLITFL